MVNQYRTSLSFGPDVLTGIREKKTWSLKLLTNDWQQQSTTGGPAPGLCQNDATGTREEDMVLRQMTDHTCQLMVGSPPVGVRIVIQWCKIQLLSLSWLDITQRFMATALLSCPQAASPGLVCNLQAWPFQIQPIQPRDGFCCSSLPE